MHVPFIHAVRLVSRPLWVSVQKSTRGERSLRKPTVVYTEGMSDKGTVYVRAKSKVVIRARYNQGAPEAVCALDVKGTLARRHE